MCWFDTRLLPGDSARRHHRDDAGLLPVKTKVKSVCHLLSFLPRRLPARRSCCSTRSARAPTRRRASRSRSRSSRRAVRDRWSTVRPTDRSILLRWSSFVGALWRGRLTASFRGGGARSLASGTPLWRRSHRSEEERACGLGLTAVRMRRGLAAVRSRRRSADDSHLFYTEPNFARTSNIRGS